MKKRIEDEKNFFTQDDIAIPCPEKMVWDEMEVVGEGRRLCDGCDKVLVDVTGYTADEVNALQKKDPTVCVAITNAFLVSSLSLSLAVAGGDIEPKEINTSTVTISESSSNFVVGEPNYDEEEVVEVEVVVGMPVFPPPVTLGLPARPTCDEGTANLNAIKRFFGFEPDRSCQERD